MFLLSVEFHEEGMLEVAGLGIFYIRKAYRLNLIWIITDLPCGSILNWRRTVDG